MKFPLKYISFTQDLHQGKCLDFGWNVQKGGPNVPVYSCDDGIVKSVEKQEKGGNVIYIEHEDGIVSCYAHLSKVNVSKNDKVKIGEQIGNMGQTGQVSGPHLHFGLYNKFENRYKNSTISIFSKCYLYDDQELNEDNKIVKKYRSKIKKYENVENNFSLGTYEIIYDDMYIRVSSSDKSARKKVKDVTKDAKSKCTSSNPKENAILKVGSRFDVLEISKNGTQIWGRTYSGWICLEGKYRYCEKVK